MSAKAYDVVDGILTMKVSGKLTEPELLQAQKAAGEIIRAHGKVRMLVLAEAFSGWDNNGAWDDMSFQEEFDPYIEKMAIVGDSRWEEWAMIFVASGLRKFPIEFFTTDKLETARIWLKENS